jgi:hypothetical protein
VGREQVVGGSKAREDDNIQHPLQESQRLWLDIRSLVTTHNLSICISLVTYYSIAQGITLDWNRANDSVTLLYLNKDFITGLCMDEKSASGLLQGMVMSGNQLESASLCHIFWFCQLINLDLHI